MSGKSKKKFIFAIVIELLCLFLLGAFLNSMQTTLAVNEQKRGTQEKLQQITELVENSGTDSQQTTDSYDANYKAKAASVAYMFQNNVATEYTDAKMKELKSLLKVDNVLILDKTGNQLAKASDSSANFTFERFNQSRTTFTTRQASEAFEVSFGDQAFRYYGAMIDDDTMVVIEKNSDDLTELLAKTDTWGGLLGNVSVGLDGYAFAVSSQYYTFLYHPDDQLIDTDALNAGISKKDLQKGHYGWLTVNGEELYCGVTKLDDAYVVCAVTKNEIVASRAITIAVILFAAFAVMTLIIAYAFFMRGEHEEYREFGKWRYNKSLGHKIRTISLVGLIFILLVSFYMQTLFSLSQQSMSNDQRVKDVEKQINQDLGDITDITKLYDERNLNKCQIAAYIINQNSELTQREDLTALADILGVQFVDIYDSAGSKTATSSPYTNFQISDDPEDQSYDFQSLLNGMEYVIQEPQPDEISGEYRQYIGVSTRDKEGNASGFVQIAVDQTGLDKTIANMQIDSVLKNVTIGKSGFTFAVEREDQTFAYYPEEKLIGRKAVSYGLDKSQFQDEYSGYMTLNGKTYYGSCLETKQYYVYVVVPKDSIMESRLPITLAAVGICLAGLIILLLLLTISRKPVIEDGAEEPQTEDNARMVDAVMPNGTVKKTETAASRWANQTIGWKDKTPGQQISLILKVLFSILAIVICLAVLLKEQFFGNNSIFRYVLDGTWDRGINIFALTGCIMLICVITVATMLVRQILRMMSNTLGARGETICRLISSFVKYFSVIAMLYYCLALLGVNTKTLLASAGILSLVVGLGAKTLVSDILAGLFIIFEGEFRVGDIVTVGDWRGTVAEIGIRTTKIEDASQNIKVISNSEVSGVINMTRQHSYAWTDIGIEYRESLERVENILETEFPNIRRRLPKIIDGPFYKGVIEFDDNSVKIRVMVVCAESDRVQMGRDLNREMKLLFDKYDINIPFPQVVLNQPSQFQKASEWEKWKADKFNAEQKELSSETTQADDH